MKQADSQRLRSAESFLAGLRDGREVYYRGRRVADVVDHPELGIAARHAALDFELADDPRHAALAVTEGYSTFYAPPRCAPDLRRRSKLIELSTRHGATLVVLVKEIGTDALFALQRATWDTDGYDRVVAFYEHARDRDLALAVAQTDVKGDRSTGPAGQPDPDVYLRIVDRSRDGVVVRGAKAHTSCAPNVDELVVLPTRALDPVESDWAISFAVPVATPGVKLICSDYLDGEPDPWRRPISSHHKMIECLTVFDDVFVPWERVFLNGDATRAGRIALGFVEYHRLTAVSYKLPLLDALVGLAFSLADANGIARASHVREKLTWLIAYAENVRALTHVACERAAVDEPTGLAFPDPLTTNLAKWTFARDYYPALEHVIDIAGGLIVTGPGTQDWDSELRPYLDKYLGAALPADERLALINLASDLLVSSYAGYQGALAVHAEGSLEAEKLTLFRAYDQGPARTFARSLAGLDA